MKLYSEKDLRDYHFLADKYCELSDKIPIEQIDIARRFLLMQIKMTKDMMDELGTEVPDDKAKELGFEL